MAKINVKGDPRSAMIGGLLALTVLVIGAGQCALQSRDTFLLLNDAQTVDAKVVDTWHRLRPRGGHWWHYNVVYQFTVETELYEREAQVPYSVWVQAQEDRSISVVYLPTNPNVNAPAFWGTWLPLYLLYPTIRSLMCGGAVMLAVLSASVALLAKARETRTGKTVAKALGAFACVAAVGGVVGMLSQSAIGSIFVTGQAGSSDVMLAVLSSGLVVLAFATLFIWVIKQRKTKGKGENDDDDDDDDD